MATQRQRRNLVKRRRETAKAHKQANFAEWTSYEPPPPPHLLLRIYSRLRACVRGGTLTFVLIILALVLLVSGYSVGNVTH